MTKPISGGCLCGTVRYKISGVPVSSFNCHCRDCQRTSGSGFAPVILVKRDNAEASGNVNFYDAKADNGCINSRGFCPVCGSQLFELLERMPGMLTIKAGTLDEPSQFKPQMDFYTASAQPWDFMNPDLPKLPRQSQTN